MTTTDGDRARDARKTRALGLHGIAVLRLTWEDVNFEPARTLGRVREGLDAVGKPRVAAGAKE